jgi:hypothetical protein
MSAIERYRTWAFSPRARPVGALGGPVERCEECAHLRIAHLLQLLPAEAGGQLWIACRPRFFLSVEVLSRLFRRLFLERLTVAYQAGRLQFFADQADLAEPARFKAYVAALRKVAWVVYAKRPFAGPGAVLAYLSRYTHRIAIANSRLVAFDGERVTSNGRITGPRATLATS